MKNTQLSYSFTVCLFLLILSNNLYAQVPNDKAEQAYSLQVDTAPYPSDTKHCTLEEDCIDRKLTSKCLVYHNDQWFTFTTAEAEVYYLSIRNQDCRDVNGVQLQVLEGHICKPSTYKVQECISLSTQDDIYLTLRSLKKNHTYILNVDGYLEDFCQFEIAISTTLPDFAVRPLTSLQDLNGQQKNGRVLLQWKLNEVLQSVRTETFEIRRRFEQEKKFYPIAQLNVERTVHGQFKTDYHYMDTVGRKGMYYYQVIALTSDSSKYLAGEFATLSQPIKYNAYEQLLEVPCKDKTALSIVVYNWENNFLMGKIPVTYYNGSTKINPEPFFAPGILRLKLIVVDSEGKKLKEFLVDRK